VEGRPVSAEQTIYRVSILKIKIRIMTREFIEDLFGAIVSAGMMAKDAIEFAVKKDQFVVIEKNTFENLKKGFLLLQEKLTQSAVTGDEMVTELYNLRAKLFEAEKELLELRSKEYKLRSAIKDFFPELNIELWMRS